MERNRLREEHGAGAKERGEGRQVGDRLLAEGDGGAGRGFCPGGRP